MIAGEIAHRSARSINAYTFLQSGAGAKKRTAQNKARETVSPLDFGATGDGATDDTAALAAALATGKLVYLDPTKTYAFGSQLTPPSNGGFVGFGKLKMLTGTGKFDAAAYGSAFASNITGVFIDGKVDTRIEAIFEMESNAGIRVCNPVSVRSSTNVTVIGEASGFKEMQHGALSWDSNVGGYVRWFAHDCTPNSTTLGSMQVTGFEVDNNRVASVNSTGLIFDVAVKNIRLGAAARVTYGEQTDAVNIQSQGFNGFVGRIYAEEIGECLDCFGDGNNIKIVVKNAYAYGVKLIHGASHNIIDATVDGTVGHALVYGGSSTSTKSVQYNDVRVTAKNVGTLTGGAAIANASAVATDGTSATYKPQYNRTQVTALGDGAAMKYVVFEESGSYNTYDADGTGWATQFGSVGALAGAGNVIRRKRGTHIRAYVGTATSVTNGNPVPFDTEVYDQTNEFDPATYTATVRCAGRYLVRAQVRFPSIATVTDCGLSIFKNGTRISRFNPIQPAASSREHWVQTEGFVDCSAGDTITVQCITSAGTVSVTNLADYSFLEIEQV